MRLISQALRIKRAVLGLTALLTFGYLLIYIYVFLYHPPLLVPNQKQWVHEPLAREAKLFLAKRWGTIEDDILVLRLWNSNAGERITLLEKQTMASATLLSIEHHSTNISNPLTSELEAMKIDSFTKSDQKFYLLEEYVPKTVKETKLVRNYYSGKYPWLGSPSYRVPVSANPQTGWFAIGNAHFPLLLGFPINVFIVRVS